ncbi:hypothetical protein [Aliiroseovarius sp. F20344]|uniref:hypothetical protein n=1 Tax=Aliiroseovarius sp. F20344 TaxID=2926414 RepID=UPI001FF39CC5|nr:hypothetical protein [Aliiroseovarius sp. F20344]MCK0142448.1 hypothetical protein [Aliiroseovarius sp. F20344]
MTTQSIIGTVSKRLLGAVVIVTALSSCALMDRVGGVMKNAVGLGDCKVASDRGLVEQSKDAPSDDLMNGDRAVMYTSKYDRAKRPPGCWWAAKPGKTRTVPKDETPVDETPATQEAAVEAVATETAAAEKAANDKVAVAASASPIATQSGDAGLSLEETNQAWDITYLGVQTKRLDDELVQINVRLEGEVNNENVAAYAECAAAQYTLSRGYGFARHVLTSVTRDNSIWTGKAVFWVSETLPEGLITIDAAVTAQSCFENGIPTV